MDLKQQLISKAFQLLQDPRIAKAAQNPKVMQGLMGALKLRALVQEQVQQNLNEGVRRVVKRLNLATESEVRELTRAVHRLERELDEERLEKRRASRAG